MRTTRKAQQLAKLWLTLLRQTWFVLIPSAVLMVVGVGPYLQAGHTALIELSLWLGGVYVGVVLIPFGLHETGHLIALWQCPNIREIGIEAKLFRVSVRPQGQLTRWQSSVVALSGPVVVALLGAMIAFQDGGFVIGILWMSHLLFLLPVFGDGKALFGMLGQPAEQRSA